LDHRRRVPDLLADRSDRHALAGQSSLSPDLMMRRLAANDRIDAFDRHELIDAMDRHEPIDSSDPAEAIEPTDRIEPTEPIESTEPLEQIDSTESSDHSDHLEVPASFRTNRMLRARRHGAARGRDLRPLRHGDHLRPGYQVAEANDRAGHAIVRAATPVIEQHGQKPGKERRRAEH